ncbi:MAG: flagellar protein FlaG [Clostridia bacterium]|jgi:flagellar protein FlaG
MNDSYIDSATGIMTVRTSESQSLKDSSFRKQNTESFDENLPFGNNDEFMVYNNEAQLDKQISELNNTLIKDDKRIEYSIYKETNTVVFRVINSKTNEILKEIPSTKLMDFSVAVLERFGLIADKEV